MNAKLKLAAVGCLVSLGMAGNAMALPTLSNAFDGPFDPFAGFEWDQSGSVMTVGPVVNGGTVTSYFMSFANNITQVGGGNFATPNIKMGQTDPTGSYEYTTYVEIQENVVCFDINNLARVYAANEPCDANAAFTNPTGTWSVFYDTSPDANVVTGSGVSDGIKIIAGTVNSGGGNFGVQTLSGIFTYNGAVTLTDPTYVNPSLISSTGTATLQFGTSATAWTQPTGFSSGASDGGTVVIPTGALLFQGDGNQTFTPARVPEPATLALLGIVAAGIGFAGRRKA